MGRSNDCKPKKIRHRPSLLTTQAAVVLQIFRTSLQLGSIAWIKISGGTQQSSSYADACHHWRICPKVAETQSALRWLINRLSAAEVFEGREATNTKACPQRLVFICIHLHLGRIVVQSATRRQHLNATFALEA